METSQWHCVLRKAWRQYCDEVGEVDPDPEQFANAALTIAESNTSGVVAVFRSGHAALQGIETPPSDKQVLDFYAKIVDEESCPLGMPTQWAASEHQAGRGSDEEVMEYLGFSKRQYQKDQFATACAVSASTGPANPPTPRRPASIMDTRFEKRRERRTIRCDRCWEWKRGNNAGAFCDRHQMPRAGERKAAWDRGD